MAAIKHAVTLLALIGAASVSIAQPSGRTTIWDLKLGQPISAQPPSEDFRGFACGSNGGSPRAPLKGWSDYKHCPAEPSGLHEVYFEYDDELEYIARAHDIDTEITRWAGTTEFRFPLIVSALFDDAGILKGIRMVTDSRPEHRNDVTEADLRTREDAYLFGGMMASRFDIEPKRNCTTLPRTDGESDIGGVFVRETCERVDQADARRIMISVNFYRKPGQSAVNPQLPTQPTEGQFESSARLEIDTIDSH